MPAELRELAAAILARLRDVQAEFELQALVLNETDSVWLARRGQRLTLRALGNGGGEVSWQESAFGDVDPELAFDRLRARIDLVVLYTGGPLPDELMGVFQPDESGPVVRYRAEWGRWDEFENWLSARPGPEVGGR
jgi:hypothetical protein